MNTVTEPLQPTAPLRRINGKMWHAPRKPQRLTRGLTAYTTRRAVQRKTDEVRQVENSLKAEKEAKRQKWIDGIKKRRNAKAERERYEMLAAKMHRKRLERLKRREKRNIMLKER